MAMSQLSPVIGFRADGRPIYLMQGGSTPEPAPTGAATPPETPEDSPEKPLGDDGIKALRAERKRASEAERRANELEARVKEFEDKGKTDEQRRQESDQKLASERDTATVKALRYEVCADKDLPLAAARFLTGSTKAEIEEAADAFKALGIAAPGGKPAKGLPPSPNAGNAGKPATGSSGRAEAERRGFVKAST